MIFTATPLAGAYVVEPEPVEDARGFFARVWCAREFATHGLETHVAQCSVSFTRHRGTLRGLHYQAPPHEEVKLVRCTRGAIFDVIVDLRQDSPTFLRHVAVELTAENRRTLYVPRRFAHGFQTLADETEVAYPMSEFFAPGASRGVRWNDPALGIPWPIADPIMLDRDRSYADLRPSEVFEA
jgi:dTDP-4-dehydrorhamnose 3,5-epimerase